MENLIIVVIVGDNLDDTKESVKAIFKSNKLYNFPCYVFDDLVSLKQSRWLFNKSRKYNFFRIDCNEEFLTSDHTKLYIEAIAIAQKRKTSIMLLDSSVTIDNSVLEKLISKSVNLDRIGGINIIDSKNRSVLKKCLLKLKSMILKSRVKEINLNACYLSYDLVSCLNSEDLEMCKNELGKKLVYESKQQNLNNYELSIRP